MRPYGIAVLVMLVVFPICASAFAAEYQVKQDGTGDFTTIQAAIDAAQDGDVIVVHPGTYYENIRFDGKNITLRSLDPEDGQVVASTIIDGGQNEAVVTFAGTENAPPEFIEWVARSERDGAEDTDKR